MNTSIQRTMTAAELSNEEVLEAQVTQLWGDNAIAQKHATEGALSFPVGEGEIEIARWVGKELVVTPPAGEPFVLRAGHSAEVKLGELTFRVSVDVREEKPRKNLAAAVLEDGAVRTIAGSGVVHAVLFAAFAFFMPAMSSADDTGVDRQRIIDLKAYLQSSAEREQDRKLDVTQGDSAPSGGATGQRAQGEEGKAGGPKQIKEGRMAIRGDERPENVQLARERALREAAEFGMIGIIAQTTSSDPNAPVVPWGDVQRGSDSESHTGSLYGADFGDVYGNGLGLSGAGEGGGGKGQGIGLTDFGGFGTCDATCVGNRYGHGHGTGHLQGSYTPHGPQLHFNGTVTSNGRLDPAVIQRIVRLNSGRFIGCYKDGLRTNPSLQGRVAVAFVIGRDGDVTIARDTSGSDLADQNVRACVVKSFSGLSFPEPAGGIVNVTYPFTFTPE